MTPLLGPVALVVNPVAMRTSSRLRAEALRALAGRGLEWSLVTRGPGDAGRLAAQAAAEGAGVVVTVGGDGTVSEAAGALAGGPVALAPLPGGNANVFARAVGWPNDPHRALATLARALGSGTVARGAAGTPAGGRPRPGLRDQRRDGARRRDRRVDRDAAAPQAPPAMAGVRPRRRGGHRGRRAPCSAADGERPRRAARGRAGLAGGLRLALHLLGPLATGPRARGILRRAAGLAGAHPRPAPRAHPPGGAHRDGPPPGRGTGAAGGRERAPDARGAGGPPGLGAGRRRGAGAP